MAYESTYTGLDAEDFSATIQTVLELLEHGDVELAKLVIYDNGKGWSQDIADDEYAEFRAGVVADFAVKS